MKDFWELLESREEFSKIPVEIFRNHRDKLHSHINELYAEEYFHAMMVLDLHYKELRGDSDEFLNFRAKVICQGLDFFRASIANVNKLSEMRNEVRIVNLAREKDIVKQMEQNGLLTAVNWKFTKENAKNAIPDLFQTWERDARFRFHVVEGDIASVLEFLRSGHDPNFPHHPLALPCWRGNVHLAEILIEHGAQLLDKHFLIAIEGKSFEIIELFISNGFRFEELETTKLLSSCLQAYSVEMLDFLIERGILNLFDSEGRIESENFLSIIHRDIGPKRLKVLIQHGLNLQCLDDGSDLLEFTSEHEFRGSQRTDIIRNARK